MIKKIIFSLTRNISLHKETTQKSIDDKISCFNVYIFLRLDGLVHIDIDEASYRKGHKYLTVILDHARNRDVWLHDGHGKSVLEKLLATT